jgi:hypothetical protein
MVLAVLVSLGILLQAPALTVLAVLVSLGILLQAPALMVLAGLVSLEIFLQHRRPDRVIRHFWLGERRSCDRHRR